MPYIKKIFGDAIKIVPIIVGHISEKSALEYGKAMSKYFDDDNTIFITSSDFCHWGDNFDYQPYKQEGERIWECIKKMD